MTDPDPEEVDTTVTTEALLRLFGDRCEAALDPDDDTRPKHTVQNIRDVCESVLEDDEE